MVSNYNDDTNPVQEHHQIHQKPKLDQIQLYRWHKWQSEIASNLILFVLKSLLSSKPIVLQNLSFT